MIGFIGRVREEKWGRKGTENAAEPLSIHQLRVRKCLKWDQKITQYENSQIKVGKYNKSAYGVIIMYFQCTLSYTQKLVYAVIVGGRCAGHTLLSHASPTLCCINMYALHTAAGPSMCSPKHRHQFKNTFSAVRLCVK